MILKGFDLIKYPYLLCVFGQTGLSSIDPDLTPQNAASDQGLHCCHSRNNFTHIRR